MDSEIYSSPPISVGTAILYNKQATAGAPSISPFADPGSTGNAPIVFEPPAALTGGSLEVWIIASGGADWGGCHVGIATDGGAYGLAGTVYRGARQGVLTASLPAAIDPDTTDTLAVDLTQSQGQLLSGTQADADSYVTLCICGGELLSYETATLIAPYKYGLTYLQRLRHVNWFARVRCGIRPLRPKRSFAVPLCLSGELRRTNRLSGKLPGFNIFRPEGVAGGSPEWRPPATRSSARAACRLM